jgi:hypothetical protein
MDRVLRCSVMVASAHEGVFGSAQAFEATERELRKMLRARGILFGDGLLPTYAYAFVTNQDKIDRWSERAERLIASAEEFSKRLLEDPALFDAMGLSRAGFDLLRVDPGYKRNCVLCRPDGIPVGADVKFVEINCDSPAMMMFLDIVAQCLLELAPFASLATSKPPSASDRLFDTLLDCYREYGGKGAPTIAITDWEGQKTQYEHLRLAEHFRARGCEAVVCDPRAFRLVDGKLWLNELRIDLVYRRALANELISRSSEVAPLLGAYRDGTVCMVNPLRSHLVGAKAVLTYLALNGGMDCTPRTLLLDNAETRDMVRATPGKWVLKKSESHGGKDVILPAASGSDPAWLAALDASVREVWIAQEFLEVPQLSLPHVEGNNLVRNEKYFNWNPFMFGGRYAGSMVRVSSTPLINITLGGGLIPVFAS